VQGAMAVCDMGVSCEFGWTLFRRKRTRPETNRKSLI